MKPVKNLLENDKARATIGMGLSAAIGVAVGMKAVAKKHKNNLSSSPTAVKLANKAAEVKDNIREDINTVVSSVKAETASVPKDCCKKTGEAPSDKCKTCACSGECGKSCLKQQDVVAPETTEAPEVVLEDSTEEVKPKPKARAPRKTTPKDTNE